MYADLSRRLNQKNWNSPDGDGVNHLARAIADYIGSNPHLMHEQRLDVDYTLPDGDTDGMVKLCAIKDSNDDVDDPAIALNIECGFLKLGDDDPIDSWSDIGGKWAKATANWTNVAGNGSYVACSKATDRTGTLVSPTEAITVYLPRAGGKDPNVRQNDVIFYRLDENGVAIATGYLDDKIGTIKMWGLASGSVPGGWAIMSGSQGGSGLNCNGRFVAGISSGSVGVAAAAGSTASGTASISAHSGSGTLSHSFSGSATVSAHAASGTPTDLTHTAAMGADLAHAVAGGGGLVHNGGGADPAATPGAAVAVDNNADGITTNAWDHDNNGTVTAAAVAAALDDHTQAAVVACLADHARADIAAAIADHTISSIASQLANHTIDTSGFSVTAHNGTDIAALLGNHTDSGHTHPVGSVEPIRINLFLIERVS